MGNFQPGIGGLDAVFEHPNNRDCIVISDGQGYVIDPLRHSCIETFGALINIAIPVLQLSAIAFGNPLSFEAFGANGRMWTSKRISFDGMRDLSQEGLVLRGQAWSAIDDTWGPFALDLVTGEFTGGCYPFPE